MKELVKRSHGQLQTATDKRKLIEEMREAP